MQAQNNSVTLLFLWRNSLNLSQGRVIVEVLGRQVSILCTSDQLVAEASTYTTHN